MSRASSKLGHQYKSGFVAQLILKDTMVSQQPKLKESVILDL